MADDVKPEVIKGTQDLLGKFIKKPILTDKLLRKPPFRFLHDICTAAMKETGFFKGVINGPEDMIENIKDKEGKIAFLQKVIAAVEAANGIKLSVRPNKVVAGLEATKTNEFLQALGKALKKQQSENKQTNKEVQPAKSKSTRGHSKEPKEDGQDKKQKPSKPVVENGVHDPVAEKKKKSTENRQGISPRKKTTAKNTEEITSKASEKKVTEKKRKEQPVDPEPVQSEVLPEKNNNEDISEQKINVNPEAGEPVDVPKLDKITVNGIDGEGDQNIEANDAVAQEEEHNVKRKHTGKQKHRRSSIHSSKESTHVPEISKENEKSNEETVEKMEPPHPTPSQTQAEPDLKFNGFKQPENILQEQNKTSPSPTEPINYYSKKETNTAKDRTLISRPRTGMRPTTARPASARPAAPRIRERTDASVAEDTNKPPSGKISVVNVIVDKDVENEQDDNLISLETTHDILLDEISIPPIPINAVESQGNEHGHLVEQILEVQKELEDESRLPFSEENVTRKTEIEWENDRSSKAAVWAIEKLRTNIQTLTRSVNPLGKLLDFFQEDVESIQRELENWKSKNSSLSLQIANERSVTEQFIEPLKIHLKEIQQSIDEQLEQISVVKANIIRNNEKIKKLLACG